MQKKAVLTLVLFLFTVLSPLSGFAASVTFTWAANTDDIDGYRIYYGTSSGNHPNKVEVGNTIKYTVQNLAENTRYYFVLRAYKGSLESGDSIELAWSSATTADTQNPRLTVNWPASVSSPTISLNGTASDNVAVSRITWSTSTGKSGNAAGTTSWQISGIPLQPGQNTITVTAKDKAGNFAQESRTFNYTDGSPDNGSANSAPTANIKTYLNQGEVPLRIRFTGNGTDSDGTITAYHWDFGDGTASDLKNVSHTFSSTGQYQVSLTVTDNGGKTATATTSINVLKNTTPPSPPKSVKIR